MTARGFTCDEFGYLWLFNEVSFDEHRYFELLTAMRNDLKTGRAWAIKENFRHFWGYVYAFSAEDFFDRWYGWAIRSRLDLVKTVARMLKAHLPALFSDFRHPITNAVSEGFNSRIQPSSLQPEASATSPTTDYGFCSTAASSI